MALLFNGSQVANLVAITMSFLGIPFIMFAVYPRSTFAAFGVLGRWFPRFAVWHARQETNYEFDLDWDEKRR
ncbi:hypothetical protein E4Z66_14095 [Aliishimia ponticola]|uniref:Uncharacterized protein n=1 Tax=Aliishimia ponticola TaxID=2499833 RepID=A0A4S4NAC6_9RHOB|nr:hypothetical protein [Aliishimia ponticola]THH36179.1 hypothetical protein E4Z66_14095 [Aliishimia ponticola]